MRIHFPDAPTPKLWVTKVIQVDFNLIRPPVALGPLVKYQIAQEMGGRLVLDNLGESVPTLDGYLRYIVEFSDGKIARSTRDNLDLMMRQCGQAAL